MKTLTSQHLKTGSSGQVETNIHQGSGQDITTGRGQEDERVDFRKLGLFNVNIIEFEGNSIISNLVSTAVTVLLVPVDEEEDDQTTELAHKHASGLEKRMVELDLVHNNGVCPSKQQCKISKNFKRF